MLRKRAPISPCCLALVALAVGMLHATLLKADSYSDARAALVEAYQGGDFPAMRQAAEMALAARPGYPGALFNRALAEVLDGHAETALKTLSSVVAAGVDFGVADMTEFESLQSLPGWQAYSRAVEELYEPVGLATTVYTYEDDDFVPEGIAIGNDGKLYLGSIRHGTIIRIGDNAEVLSDATGHWSVFGMRLDANGGLWFASAAVPEFAAVTDETVGRTGLFRLDLASNKITDSASLPLSDDRRVLGDLVLVDEDTILASESLTGALYSYSVSAQQFSEVIAPGVMRSMQGLVLDATGRYLYVADYVGGLFRVALADNSVERVTADESTSLYGIDGLYRHANELVAIQNGIRPNRVIALSLSEDGLAISGHRILARNLPEFDEPTLGTVVGDDFYFVANSHWNRFDREGNLPDGLSGPMVLKLSLLKRSN